MLQLGMCQGTRREASLPCKRGKQLVDDRGSCIQVSPRKCSRTLHREIGKIR